MEARAGVMKSSWIVICSNSCLPHFFFFFFAEGWAKLLVNSLPQPKTLWKGEFQDFSSQGRETPMANPEIHQLSKVQSQREGNRNICFESLEQTWPFLPDWPNRGKPKSHFCRFKRAPCALAANPRLAPSGVICVSPALRLCKSSLVGCSISLTFRALRCHLPSNAIKTIQLKAFHLA